MTKRVGIGLVVLALAGVAFWLWRIRGAGETPATSTVTQPSGSGSGSAAPVGRSTSSATDPARVTITVAGDKGPIAGAVVRLAPEDGEVIVVRTSPRGGALAELAPGRWAISASATGFLPASEPAFELVAGQDTTLALTLVAGGRALTGTVTDATGGPIAGARIDAAKLGGMARPGSDVASTLSGTDGAYSMTVAEGQLLVAASSADYAAQSRLIEVGANGAVASFSLVPGGAIEGIVRDERTRQPVAGASVVAERDRGGTILLAEANRKRTISGPDGRFRIGALRPGAYELDATAATRTAKSPTIVGLGVAEQVADVEILISDGPVISGTVVDEAGTAVEGVEVTAIGHGRGGGDATSDAKGAFTITGLSPGAYFLMGRSATYVPAGGAQVELADKGLTAIVVKVQRGAKIVGHVEPRQICEVQHDIDDRVLGAGMPMLVGPKTTGADGEFELGPASAGKARLRARCPSGAQGSLPIDVEVGMSPLVIAVTLGASIAGRVLDGEGTPVAGATVMASIEGPTQRTMIVNGMVTSGVQGITGTNGTYELVGLTAGSYVLDVLDRGRPLRMRGARVVVKLATTDQKTGVDLAVDRPNGVIKGVVTGPDGKPLADAWVSVQQDLAAMIEGMVERGPRRERPPGGDGGEEEGSSMMTIEARDDDGEGAAGAGFAPVLTDVQGRFEISGLPHAKYEAIAEAQAGKLRGRTANVTPDATVAIKVLGVTTLSGTVKGASGPAPVFSIELDGPTTAARTFTDGKFQLGRVDPGAYVVRVTSSQGNAEVKVEVKPDQPTTVDITLVANAIVIGKLVDPQNQPLAGAPLTLVPDSGDGRVQVSMEGPPPTSGTDGSFRLETKAGPGVLVVLIQPRPFTKRGLVLEAGKTLDLGTVRVESGPPKPP